MFYNAVFKQIENLEEFLDRDIVKTMIGENYDHYRELWLQHEQKIKKERKKIEVKGRVNWLSILSPLAWYGYRKMHASFWTMTVMFAALVAYETYYDTEVLKSAVGLFFAFALMSKSMYLGEILRKVKVYDALPNAERKENYLKHHAGISKILAWVYGIGYLVILFCVAVAAYQLSPHYPAYQKIEF